MLGASIYERDHPNRQDGFGIAMGRIVAVKPEKRLCTVKTFLGSGSMDDNHIEECQWLNLDSNPEGDESGSIPRKGSTGVVFFIDGEPFIMGYFRALNADGNALTGNEVSKLTEGDKIIASVGGNKITIKSSGLIEIASRETLKRLYFPTGSLILDICKAYNMKADGGDIEWKQDELKQTLHRAEYRTNLARLFIIVEERGFVDPTTVYKKTMGAGVPGIKEVELPSYRKTIDITGKVTTEVGPPGLVSGWKETISPTGEHVIVVNELITITVSALGDYKVEGPVGKLDISATGALEFANAVAKLTASVKGDLELANAVAKLTASAEGDIELANAVTKVTISSSGDVAVETPGEVKLDAKKGVTVTTLGDLKVEAKAGEIAVEALTATIKAAAGVKIDGGTGASDFVLTNPTTLSPFTGAPLAPFSTTVQVSK